MELELQVITAIRRITDRFIRLGKSTPVHEIKSKLGAKRRALDGLGQERIIQTYGAAYLPCLRAVTEFGEPDTQKLCFGYTEKVLTALKWIYNQQGEKDCSREEVRDIATHLMEIPMEADTLRIGMLFATEFRSYRGSWISDAEGGVSSIRVTEGILDFDTIEFAWQNELHKRGSEAEAERAKLAGERSARLDDPADLDSLLELYNRGRFNRDLPEQLSAASADVPLSMIMIDLDEFKQVNDAQGHPMGDRALKVVASHVKVSCSGKGPCYRWGGDEIAILLRNYSLAEAMALGERLRGGIEQAALSWRVTASVGIACFPHMTEKPEQLLNDADRAMYKAKNAGGNRVCTAELAGTSASKP